MAYTFRAAIVLISMLTSSNEMKVYLEQTLIPSDLEES